MIFLGIKDGCGMLFGFNLDTLYYTVELYIRVVGGLSVNSCEKV